MVTAIGTWIYHENNWQPCLALVRTGEEAGDQTRPCIILQNNAHIWFEDFKDPAPAVSSCYRFLEALRIPLEKKNVNALLSFVHELIPDLLHIPPMPPIDDGQIVLGEVTVTDKETGRTVAEHVLTDV